MASKKKKTASKNKTDDFAGFGPGLIQFYAELSTHNDREWFEANKPRYEEDIREPARAFIRAFAPHLAKISKHLVASDKKAGGSLMRIYRDVRFSKDKTPYKTNLGIQFRHAAGKDVHAPGLYVHLDADGVFLGAGTWRPESSALQAIRERIATKGKAWTKIRDDPNFTAHWSLGGDSLVRPPRGFAKDHPQLEDLKRKDHIAVCNLETKELFGPEAPARLAAYFAETTSYMRFLCKALDVPF